MVFFLLNTELEQTWFSVTPIQRKRSTAKAQHSESVAQRSEILQELLIFVFWPAGP